MTIEDDDYLDRYPRLNELARDGVVILEGHVIKYANRRFAEMLGYELIELEGRSFTDLMTSEPTRLSGNAGIDLNLLMPDEYVFESMLRTKTYMALPVEIQTWTVQLDGRSVDMMLVRDISERRILEEKLEKRSLELCRKNHCLTNAAQLKIDFILRLSNELKSSLNSMIGFTEFTLKCVEGPLNDGQQDCLKMVLKHGHRLMPMLNNMLELVRIHGGKCCLNAKMFDMHGILSEIIAAFEKDAEKHLLKMKFVYPEGLIFAYGDTEKVKFVLAALISNAIKYTRAGTIGIVVEDQPNDDFITVMVWDTGIGVPDVDKSDIFNEFHQMEGTNRHGIKGSGLSLAVAKYYITIHGGKIWVEDNISGGSKFYFTLPKVQTGTSLQIAQTAADPSEQKLDSPNRAKCGCGGLNAKPCAFLNNNIHWCDVKDA